MRYYEICYLHQDGTLAGSFNAQCNDHLHAKILAHAMKAQPGGIEVWQIETPDARLVYRRPLNIESEMTRRTA